MKSIEVVCLCEQYDLKGFFGSALMNSYPRIKVVNPDEVTDGELIRHAMVFKPADNAFEKYPNLELLCCAGAGVDGLLAHPGLKPDMTLTRVVLAEQAQMISAFVLWHIVGWQRKLQDYFELQRDITWKPINRTAPSRFSVGVLGYGNLGRTLACNLQSLGYPVQVYGSQSRSDEGIKVLSGSDGLKTIARESYAVVNMLPLTDSTHSILDKEFFGEMKTDAILVNVGRGEHVVDRDLVSALDAGRPGFAALDAFCQEPLPKDHPFWRHEKIMVTPHVAGDADPESVASWIGESISQYENGEVPQGFVNRDRGY